MEKMRLMLEKVIMSDTHVADGQMYSFLQLFYITEKNSLNWRSNSTATDYVLLIFVVIVLSEITILLKYMSIWHKIRKNINAAWMSIVFLFDNKFLFLTEDTEE